MQALQLFIDSIHTSAWLSALALVYLGLTLWAIVHVLLNKELSGSAISWIGIILLSPGVGFILYWLLGINRIKRRAQREFNTSTTVPITPAPITINDPQLTHQLKSMMKTGRSIHRDDYINQNAVMPLINGNDAYPAMLNSINRAKLSIVLSSYIFDYDDTGKQFINALSAAHKRGVEIRVLIDGVGIGYSFSWTKTDFALRRLGIPTARFLPTLSRHGTRFINLRNHRKILSVDGTVAYIGGINIRDNNVLQLSDPVSADRTRDLHFRVNGPVIDQINKLFIDDWQFACGEQLKLPDWQGDVAGDVICRVLPDGPDENYHKLQLTLTSAINSAARQVSVVTPYFLPDGILQRALVLASLRGVDVKILVPEISNIRIVDWALRASMRSLLTAGVKILLSPAPFDHSKLFLIDDSWCLIGSSNWDARSLELNFEVNLECINKTLIWELSQIFADKASTASLVTTDDLARDSFVQRLRNNFFKLFSPYL